MAIVNNILFQGFRGKLGDMVFKQRNGKTYVSAAPKRDPGRMATAKEQEVRSKFKQCSAYASEALRDPLLKWSYEQAAKEGQSAYNVAFADAFHGPEVLSISRVKYRGRLRNILIIAAKDNFKVIAVKVSIFDKAGKLLEKGDAVKHIMRSYWKYTTTKRSTKITGARIIATAADLPGNEGTLEVKL